MTYTKCAYLEKQKIRKLHILNTRAFTQVPFRRATDANMQIKTKSFSNTCQLNF